MVRSLKHKGGKTMKRRVSKGGAKKSKKHLSSFKNSDYIMKNGILIGCHQGLKTNQIKYIHKKSKNI